MSEEYSDGQLKENRLRKRRRERESKKEQKRIDRKDD
jgi:hypothetical protein